VKGRVLIQNLPTYLVSSLLLMPNNPSAYRFPIADE
jgi:hypothetical protein